MTFGLCLQGPLLSAIQLNMRKPHIYFKGDMQSCINLIFLQCVVPENIHTPFPPLHTHKHGGKLSVVGEVIQTPHPPPPWDFLGCGT